MNRRHESPIVTIQESNRFIRTLNCYVSVTGMHIRRNRPCSERAYKRLRVRTWKMITLLGNDEKIRQQRRARSMTLVGHPEVITRVVAHSRWLGTGPGTRLVAIAIPSRELSGKEWPLTEAIST